MSRRAPSAKSAPRANAGRRRSRIALVVALVLLTAAIGAGLRLFLVGRYGTTAGIGSGGTAPAGGPFALIDQDGRARTDVDFRGRFMLVYFGYTYNQDAAANELIKIDQTLDRLGARAEQLQPIFITIDPERDTPPTLKKYVSRFHSHLAGLVGLTGTPEEIAAAARAFRLYYAKVPIEGDGRQGYLMDYPGLVYLIGPDGRYITHFTRQTTPGQMAKAIAEHF